MKRALTIAVAGAALAATLSFVAADTSKRGLLTEAVGLPAYEIIATVRAHGLAPISEPARSGPYYVLHATDPRGIEMRVVVDALFGDIISVAPARPLATAYTPRYERGARIIQVPQAGGHDEPAVSNDDAAEEVAPVAPRAPRRVAPQPRSDAAPVPKRRSNAPPPPPPGPRRNVVSAPPPPAEGPSPIHRTPRFNSNVDGGDKFGPPRDPDVASSTLPPPPGYTPPAALPRGD